MTELEAKGYLQTLANRIPLKFFTDDAVKVYDEFSQIALDALEKQIPKKPVGAHKNYKGDLVGYRCPSCNESVELETDDIYDYRFKFCDCCGQKLDWSEK